MLQIGKYLKPYVLLVIAAIVLLSLQAYGDLALPDYMSRMVDKGIASGGIENSVPEAVRKSTLEKYMIFMNETEKEEVLASFTLEANENLSNRELENKYPALKQEPVYIRKNVGEEKMEKLDKIFSKSMLFTAAVANKDNPDMSYLSSGFDMSFLPEGADPFAALTNMPKEYFSELMSKADSIIEEIPETMMSMVSNSQLKQEYTQIGIDIKNYQTNYVISVGKQMLLFVFFIMLSAVLQNLITSIIGAGLGRDLRKAVFGKVVRFSSKEFDDFSTASLITRSTNDIEQIQNIFGFLLRTIIFAPIMGIGGIFKVLNTNAGMTWIIALAVGIISFTVIVIFSIVSPKFMRIQKLIDRLNLVVRESLSGMLVIRAFGKQDTEEKKFEKANDDLTNLNLFVNRIVSLMFPLMMLIMNSVSILIVWIGGKNIDAGTLKVGQMMAFIQYAMQIMFSFLMISFVSIMLPRSIVAAKRIAEVLKSKTSINDPEEKDRKQFDETKKGYIEFKNVSFKYPNAEDYVLKNINFVAVPGKTTAFIGSTGSGKSTIANLIPRFYDATEGEVVVEGVNIKNVTQHDLHDRIGYIPQYPLLFSGTIESNIKFSGSPVSDEQMVKAAKTAQAEEFINERANGYYEPISQAGANISGGQKQRLSIARAIAKKPQIFIFDDSFSALDYKTDAALRREINSNLSDRTILIVAQRIGTVKNVDQIIVLENGEIVGKGTHKELMANCKVYKEIALSQLSKEELENE